MRIIVATVVSAATALGLAVAVATPAAADSPDRTLGGCSYDTQSSPGATERTGVISDASVTHTPDGLPIGAVVTCKIQVNGVDAPGTSADFPGYGAQAGAQPISFTAADFDVVVLCQQTVYADGTSTDWYCPGATTLPLPPQWVIDDINLVVGIVNGISVYDVDPHLCPVLAAHPGTYGGITVEPDGDVYAPDPLELWDGPLYDCPPYGDF